MTVTTMPDYRTKRQKLQAMADQTVSPNEAEVARAKLEAMKDEPVGKKTSTRFFINGQEFKPDFDFDAYMRYGPMRMSNHFSDDHTYAQAEDVYRRAQEALREYEKVHQGDFRRAWSTVQDAVFGEKKE